MLTSHLVLRGGVEPPSKPYKDSALTAVLTEYNSPCCYRPHGQAVYGGIGRIRTYEGFTPQKFSRLRPYDHLGTMPNGGEYRIRTYEPRRADCLANSCDQPDSANSPYGWGWESRTPTHRVKVCCAAVTPIPNILCSLVFVCPKRQASFRFANIKGEKPWRGTPDGIRTHTERFLRPLPLPVGLRERVSVCISLRHIFNYTKKSNLVKIQRTKNYQKFYLVIEHVFCSLRVSL